MISDILVNIGLSNILEHFRYQAITWTNAYCQLDDAAYFNGILLEIQKFPFKKMLMKMLFTKY